MRILVVKTSSMGDVLHTLPALTDAASALPGIRFDWVVEEGFAEIPAWHPAVDNVIPVALRRWRKRILATLRGDEWQALRQALRQHHYDAVIDAQGLLKSAWIPRLVAAPAYGLDRHSAREPLASLLYQHKIPVAKDQHAVTRVRQLFARSLNYALPDSPADYGIRSDGDNAGGALVFLHATTREDKHWPEANWAQLCALATAAGFRIKLPWADDEACARAQRLAAANPAIEVLPRLTLAGIADELRAAAGIVAVDTGLGHMAAALHAPCVSLYCVTDPARVGAFGPNQLHLQTPAPFASLGAEQVWSGLLSVMEQARDQA